MKRPLFGISPLGPSRKVKAAVRKAVGNINGSLADRISRLERLFFSRYGIPKENLIIACSVEELIADVFQAFNPVRALVAGPDAGLFANVASDAGISADVMTNATDPASPTDPGLFAGRAADYDVAYLSNPNNVSGNSVDGSFPERFAGSRCLLVIDESFIGFPGSESCMQSAAQSDNVMVIGTTANYFGLAGLELAYAVASESVISGIRRKQVCRVSILAVEAAMAAMKDKAFVRTSADFIHRERDLLTRAAERIPGCRVYKSCSNMLLMKVPYRADDLIRAAKRSELAVRSCRDIVGLDNTFVSVSIMKHELNLKLAGMMKKLLMKAPDAVEL